MDERGYRTSFGYSPTGLHTRTTDALGNVNTISYDLASQPIVHVDPLGGATTTVYNATGNTTCIIRPDGVRTTEVHDVVGALTAVTEANGVRTTFVYDTLQRSIATVDPNGFRASTVYNADGLIAAQTDADGYTSSFTYDSAGNLRQAIDPRGHTTTSSYDALDREIRRVTPLGATTTQQYDTMGRRKVLVLASAARITAHYDPVGNQLSRTYADGTRISFLYDTNSNLLLCWDSNGRTTFAYDATNRQDLVVDPHGFRATYIYNAIGNQKTLSLSGDERVTYSYTATGQLSNINSAKHGLTTYSYDSALRRISKESSNGLRTTFVRDGNDRVTAIIVHDALATLVKAHTYTYDPVGNRLSAADAERRTTWIYGPSNQLISEHIDGVRTTYSYDDAQNRRTIRTAAGITTMLFNAGNELTRAAGPNGVSTFAYDTRGNRVASIMPATTTTFTWDDDNQLVRKEDGAGGTATYIWNGLLERVATIVDGEERRYVWGGANVIAETNDSGAPLLYYNLAPATFGEVISEARLVDTEWSTGVFLFDASGSTIALSDDAGTVIDEWTYDAWGNVTSQSGSSETAILWHGESQYLKDRPNEEYFVRSRVYAPQDGVWLSMDPLFGIDGLNAYEYSRNNPIMLADPSGMSCVAAFDCCRVCTDEIEVFAKRGTKVNSLDMPFKTGSQVGAKPFIRSAEFWGRWWRSAGSNKGTANIFTDIPKILPRVGSYESTNDIAYADPKTANLNTARMMAKGRADVVTRLFFVMFPACDLDPDDSRCTVIVKEKIKREYDTSKYLILIPKWKVYSSEVVTKPPFKATYVGTKADPICGGMYKKPTNDGCEQAIIFGDSPGFNNRKLYGLGDPEKVFTKLRKRKSVEQTITIKDSGGVPMAQVVVEFKLSDKNVKGVNWDFKVKYKGGPKKGTS